MISINALRPDRVRVLTFDCYGTLIDWNGGIWNAFEKRALKDGVVLDREHVLAAYHRIEPEIEQASFRPYRDILTEVARRVAEACEWRISDEQAAFLPESLPDWSPFPDTNDALERLASRYRLGILSNVDDDLLAGTRKHLDVDFDFWVTADRVRSYKPDLAHFEAARPYVGDPGGWLHVAQSLFHDVGPASVLGLPVVWVNRLGETRTEGHPVPDLEVPDLATLADRLITATSD